MPARPPKEFQFKPGQSGNPAGRKTAGASVAEWYNSLIEHPIASIRKIAVNEKLPVSKRIAAQRILRAMEQPKMADYAPLIDGIETLEEVEKRGVDTSVIKKLKHRAFTTEDGTTEKTCEIELHDRSGEDVDRICDRTEGKPRQAMDLRGDILPTRVEIITPTSKLAGGAKK